MCEKNKTTVSSQISIIIFIILYPPKAIGVCKTTRDDRKLQEKEGSDETTGLLHVCQDLIWNGSEICFL